MTFQEKARIADGAGGYTVTWANVASRPTTWAEITESAPSERIYGDAVADANRVDLKIRYRDDLSIEMRCTLEGRTLQVRGIIVNADGRKRYTIVHAAEGAGA